VTADESRLEDSPLGHFSSDLNRGVGGAASQPGHACASVRLSPQQKSLMGTPSGRCNSAMACVCPVPLRMELDAKPIARLQPNRSGQVGVRMTADKPFAAELPAQGVKPDLISMKSAEIASGETHAPGNRVTGLRAGNCAGGSVFARRMIWMPGLEARSKTYVSAFATHPHNGSHSRPLAHT